MKSKPLDELDAEAARRALDFYLNPPTFKPPPVSDDLLLIARDDLTGREALGHASMLLRCIAGAALDKAGYADSPTRESTLSLMHMVNMARALAERCLVEMEEHDDSSFYQADRMMTETPELEVPRSGRTEKPGRRRKNHLT